MMLTSHQKRVNILTMDASFIYKEFGRRLRDVRKKAELTQATLADRVGLSRTSITNIEKGRQRIPFHLLFPLASAVGVDPGTLLPERTESAVPGVIDRRSLKTPLMKDHFEYVAAVVTSGMERKEKQEDKGDEST
jgi:transcriptional regulator with XRE-family HTH domain